MDERLETPQRLKQRLLEAEGKLRVYREAFEAARNVIASGAWIDPLTWERYETALDALADIGGQPHTERTSLAAAQLGRLGGSSTSKAKAKASRANGKKGGRPRKS